MSTTRKQRIISDVTCKMSTFAAPFAEPTYVHPLRTVGLLLPVLEALYDAALAAGRESAFKEASEVMAGETRAAFERGFARGTEITVERLADAKQASAFTEAVTRGSERARERAAGYDVGHTKGRALGYDEGLMKRADDIEVARSLGHAKGKAEGFNEGYAAGQLAAFDEARAGHEKAVADAKVMAHQAGYDRGFEKGQDDGVRVGLQQGYSERETLTFSLRAAVDRAVKAECALHNAADDRVRVIAEAFDRGMDTALKATVGGIQQARENMRRGESVMEAFDAAAESIRKDPRK